MIELVVFDCDGVLVDSEPIALRVDKEVLARFGWHLTEAEIVDRFVGHTEEVMIAAIEEQLGHALPRDWEDEFQPLYRKALAAARMGVEPRRCAVVEDSVYGVQAARAAGMRPFAYAGGVTQAHRLMGPGTVVFDDMRDLPDLLAS